MNYCPYTGSIPYPTVQDAWKAVFKSRTPEARKHHKHRAPKKTSVTRCGQCGQWHIGMGREISAARKAAP